MGQFDYFGASYIHLKNVKKEGLLFSWLQYHWSKCIFRKKGFVKWKIWEDTTSKYHFIEGRYWLKNAFDKNYKIKKLNKDQIVNDFKIIVQK